MGISRYLFAAALMAAAVPAGAAVTVLGSSAARLCFEAADSRASSALEGVGRCNEALQGNLSDYDLVATFVNRGILKLRLGEIDASISDFDSALRHNPDEAEAYLNKGMATLRQPDGWQQAASLFGTAISKRTRRPALAYFGRAVANELGGNIRDAYFDYRQASLLDPKWRDPQVELTRFTVRQP